MSLEYIRKTYGVPATRNRSVIIQDGEVQTMGRITGSAGAYILVKMDGEKQSKRFHPTDDRLFYSAFLLPLNTKEKGTR